MKLSVFSLLCISALPAFAAKPIDLKHQNIAALKSLTGSSKTLLNGAAGSGVGSNIEEISQSTDFNQTVHIRAQQTYSGYPVWGGDVVMHTPKGRAKTVRSLMASSESTTSTMNGIVYDDLQKDLQNTPAFVFNSVQADKALAQAIIVYESEAGRVDISNQKATLKVYVDDMNKAHWVYHISFAVKARGLLAQPNYLMDATDFSIYKEWDNRKTSSADAVQGGGFGGNTRNKLIYDGAAGNLASFLVTRDAINNTCLLTNDLITVTDSNTGAVAAFPCTEKDKKHNNVFWSGNFDEVNGGYSPNNDAMYAAKIISDMYQEWYKLPVLVKDGKPMHMNMVTHEPNEGENAEWNDETETMYFGDGGDTFFPLSALGVTAHEISHGFTTQHSNLLYADQSGGMNEAFSDMADQTARFYATGKTDWMIGSDVAKQENFALRYMDEPSKDCRGVMGIECSVNTLQAYNAYNKRAIMFHKKPMNVHFSSGIYNRAFYLIATSDGFNAKKAFDVMVQANINYWTVNSTFAEGACGVLKATNDYKYDTKAVVTAFNKVGIDTSNC